jgi:hypothetical protein
MLDHRNFHIRNNVFIEVYDVVDGSRGMFQCRDCVFCWCDARLSWQSCWRSCDGIISSVILLLKSFVLLGRVLSRVIPFAKMKFLFSDFGLFSEDSAFNFV